MECRLHIGAILVDLEAKIFIKDSAENLDISTNFLCLDRATQQAKNIERSKWFSNDFLAIDLEKPDTIFGVSYSIVPNGRTPRWVRDLDNQLPKSSRGS
jgi:inner membrane protein